VHDVKLTSNAMHKPNPDLWPLQLKIGTHG